MSIWEVLSIKGGNVHTGAPERGRVLIAVAVCLAAAGVVCNSSLFDKLLWQHVTPLAGLCVTSTLERVVRMCNRTSA